MDSEIRLQRLLSKLEALAVESPPDDPPYKPTAASAEAYYRARNETAEFFSEQLRAALDAAREE